MDTDCEVCAKIWNCMVSTPDSYEGQRIVKKLMDQYILCAKSGHDLENYKPTHHRGNGKPNGIFAGTLTMSTNDATNEVEMCAAIEKIMRQKTCPVEKYAWYLEYTDAGTPHIHFIYRTECGGRIHQKVFKRYWKKWDESVALGRGFQGGYHKLVESETAYTEYIEKDGGRNVNKWTT